MIQPLRSFCILLLAALVSTTSDAQVTGTPGQGTFVLVKSNKEVVPAGRYIIVNATYGKAMKVYETGRSNYRSVSVTLNEAKDVATVTDANTAVFNLIKPNFPLSFYENNKGTYLSISESNKTSTGLGSKGAASAYTQTSINIEENGDATIQFDAGYKNNTLGYNHNGGSGLFSCYEASSTTPKPVRLYREVYTRKVTKGSYGTLCLPYSADVKKGDVSGATLYTIEGKQMEGGEVSAISLVKADTLLRGVPYIFLATSDMLEVRYKGYLDRDGATEANGLVGSYNAINVAKDMYVISQNTIKKVGSAGGHIGENRCYINMANVRSLETPSPEARVLRFDATTDGVKVIEAEADRRNAIHDLSGRRVKTTKKGLYIVNGKKIIK